jgi:hypothetical protein
VTACGEGPRGTRDHALPGATTARRSAYSSAKAKQAVPEFRCEVGFVDGARETMLDMKQRGVWRRYRDDAEYSALVQRALDLGFEKLTA